MLYPIYSTKQVHINRSDISFEVFSIHDHYPVSMTSRRCEIFKSYRAAIQVTFVLVNNVTHRVFNLKVDRILI